MVCTKKKVPFGKTTQGKLLTCFYLEIDTGVSKIRESIPGKISDFF
jgi:hypothetical protein